MLEPIKTEKLYNIIMERITGLIKEQKLEPGDKLPSEREFASALSVSRASVRQAIAALSAKGLVVMRQGDGTYVANPKTEKDYILEFFGRFLVKTQIDPDDILEVRLLVECEAARLCALRAEPEQLAKIRNILELKTETDNDGTGESLSSNRELHAAIIEGAQNQVLTIISEVIWKIMENNMWPLLKKRSVNQKEIKKQHALQHIAIVNAICAHDAEEAANAMHNHLISIREGIDEVIEKSS